MFVKEYLKAMRPVACNLDILQGEKATVLEYLLPKLAIKCEPAECSIGRYYKSITAD